nr:hypothetical protein [uncultured Dongia sp.]
MKAIWAGLLVSCTLLSGCESWDWGDQEESDYSTAGARLLDTKYEQVDLIAMLDPDGAAKEKYNPKPGEPATWDELPAGRKIDLAFDAYHAGETGVEDDLRKRNRDQIQERLLGASNEMCYRYKRFLQNLNSDANFWLGTLTTVTGAAGALVTGGGSQILSGAASALSGIRAEFNQDYYHNVTVATIWKGIELRRERAFNTIALQGQEKDTAVYPVEAAVKDAINYHAECSLVAGVEELGDSVQLVKDPGLDAVSRTLMKLNIARNIVETKSTNPSDLLGGSAPGSPSASLLEFGTPRGSGGQTGGANPMSALGELLQSIGKTNTESTQRLAKLGHWPDVPATDPLSRSAISSRVVARTALASKQLNNCQTAASNVSVEIAKAEGEVAVAASESARLIAEGTLAAKRALGSGVVSEMNVALAWLKADIDASIGLLERENQKLAESKTTIPAETIKAASTTLDKSVEKPDEKKLTCAQ